jgi:hypothetical protein
MSLSSVADEVLSATLDRVVFASASDDSACTGWNLLQTKRVATVQVVVILSIRQISIEGHA